MRDEILLQYENLIVVPCLNEEAHIGPLLAWLGAAASRIQALVVVADGGSVDRTREIVQSMSAGNPHVVLMDNPRRIQSVGVNGAVDRYGRDARFLIRIDAHGDYPEDYCDVLVAEALATEADSVVVSMRTTGRGTVQRATAAAQNSRLGTGGSRHRHQSQGEWVDHGHHALFRMEAFRSAGGYDETFSHNEDAELDHRLRKLGFHTWLSGRTYMTYFPRSTFLGLFRQYMAYGRGRAMNLVKHRTIPNPRQMAPLLVGPAVVLAASCVISWLAVVPFVAWATVCFGFGVWLAVSERSPSLILSALSAMTMHLAWSLGFWQQLLWPRSSAAAR